MRSILFTSIVFLMLSSLALSQPQPPDTLWTRTFGGDDYDVAYSVDQTNDGGCIIAGYTRSFGAGGTDLYYIKLDSQGNEEWPGYYGGGYDDLGYSVEQTTDGGYIIAGYTESFGLGIQGGPDVWLIRLTSTGNILWHETYGFGGSSYDDRGLWVQQTSDGGYIIVGYTSSTINENYDILLIKTDANGNQLWYQTYGGLNDDLGRCVQQTEDGGYIIVGDTYTYGGPDLDVCLIKTDAAGNEEWIQAYISTGEDNGHSVRQTTDGGYVIAGCLGGNDVWLIKTASNGDTLWTNTCGGGSGFDVQQTNDGGYIIAGTGADFIKTDSLGIEEWRIVEGGITRGVQQTEDEGYIAAGYIGGTPDVWVIRLDNIEPVQVTLTPFNPPIIIPENGGTFDFNIEVENVIDEPQTVDIWTEISLPGVGTVPVINLPDYTLSGGQSINRDREQEVPSFAPTGTYTYYGYIGDYPWVIAHYDSFTFEKEGIEDRGWLGSSADWQCTGVSFPGESATSLNVSSFALNNPFPNPFNPSTTISFELPVAGEVSLVVYDVMGREVVTLVDGYQAAGCHEAVFDAKELASGVYFARLQAGNEVRTQKMLLVR